MVDGSADETEIVDLIHRDRISFWTGDYETWAECWVQSDYALRWGWWHNGGVFIRRGFNDLRERVSHVGTGVREDFAYDTKVENLVLRIGTDMAWASYDQQYPVYDVSALAGPGLLREVRFFERHDGRWRIAFAGILDGNANPDSSVLLRLDRKGHVLWKSPAADAALADSSDLVLRNGRLRFRDERIDGKLQEAIAWASGQDRGYMSTHAARPIVVDPGGELPMRIYWLAMDGGEITFSFGADRISEERLEMAAAIYGLSPTQKRLAALVAEGLALPEIARRMGIRTNTARTHLQRIFDKTGVRTQPALVRVMLSVVAPI